MDNFCTPINQLGSADPPNFERSVNTESKKDPIPVQNYSDILKNVTVQQEPQVQQMQVPQMEPQPVMQAQPMMQPQPMMQAQPIMEAQQPYVPKQAQNKELKLDTDFQNDSLSLLSVYFLLSSECVQNFIRGKIPSMVDNNKINTFGIIINGIILLVAYNFTKKIIVKYIKDA